MKNHESKNKNDSKPSTSLILPLDGEVKLFEGNQIDGKCDIKSSANPYNIGNIWHSADIDFLENNSQKKLWNDNSTKKNSHRCLNWGKSGNNRTDTREALNMLADSFDINLSNEINNQGRKALNEAIFEKELAPLNAKAFVLKFLLPKKENDPLTFLLIINSIKIYLEKCCYVKKKIISDLTREDVADKSILLLLLNAHENSVQQFYLLNFYNFCVVPSKKMNLKKAKSSKKKFDHPIVKKYGLYQERKGDTPKSITTIQSNIKRFFKWSCDTLTEFSGYDINSIFIWQFKEEHLRDYKRYLERKVKEGEYTANGAKQHFIYIRGFFAYLYQANFLSNDIAFLIPNINAEAYKYRILPTKEEIQKFFDMVQTYAENPEVEKLAYALMIYLGFRGIEVAKLRWEDVNLDTKTISVLGKKQNQSVLLPIPEVICDMFLRLNRKKKGAIFDDKAEAFKTGLYHNFKLYCLVGGITLNGGIHNFRHSFVTRLSHFCDPQTLRILSRQRSERTVSFYLHHADEELTNAVNKIF